MADLLGRLKTALADRYAIEREVGAGGMATVFLAEDLKPHRPVAIKVLEPELAAAMGAERFRCQPTSSRSWPARSPRRPRILAQVGEAGAALDEVERILGGASEQFSVHVLRLDPRWDPIRDEPRFQALLVEYDPPQSVEVGRE